MQSILTFLTTQGPGAWNAILQVGLSVGAVLVFVHMLLVVLENFWPGLKKEDGWVQTAILFIDKWAHGSGKWGQPQPPTAVGIPVIK